MNLFLKKKTKKQKKKHSHTERLYPFTPKDIFFSSRYMTVKNPTFISDGEFTTLDSFSTKHNLQRKLKPNVTEINQPMTDEGVANSAF